MAERLYRSSDVPKYDTYPAEPPAPEKALPKDTIDEPERQLPQDTSALDERARQVGAAMGKVVVMLRRTQSRLQDLASETGDNAGTRINELTETAKAKAQGTAARVTELASAAKSKTQEIGQAAISRADELRQAAVEKASDLGTQAREGYDRARQRATRIANEYPVQVVLGAGLAGLLLGVGLRIWRANREY